MVLCLSHRNDVLDARDPLRRSERALRFNDFGWDLGGPISAGKLFFFAGQEWKRIAGRPMRQSEPFRQALR